MAKAEKERALDRRKKYEDEDAQFINIMFALRYTEKSGLGCKGERNNRDLDPMGS